jgi:hypothetical protein
MQLLMNDIGMLITCDKRDLISFELKTIHIDISFDVIFNNEDNMLRSAKNTVRKICRSHT